MKKGSIEKMRMMALQPYIKSLTEDAERILQKANQTRETQNDTYNQEDAYGYGIYYNDKLLKKGYLNDTPKANEIHKGWAKHNIEANTGRGYLDEYLDNYKPSKKGLTLIVVNAVYYSPILEDGRQGNSGRRYKILSQIASDFKQLEIKYLKR